jgi:ABC-type nitrate/sulfonate/bicarbonate transport system permease component
MAVSWEDAVGQFQGVVRRPRSVRPAPGAAIVRSSQVPGNRRRIVVAAIAVCKGAAGFAVVIGLWELALVLGVIKQQAAPTIGQFLSGIGTALSQGAIPATLSTLYAWAVTLVISVAVGVLVGMLTGLSPLLDALTSVVFDFLRPLPPIALLPAVVLVAGIGRTLEIVVGITAAVWPVLLGAHYGVTHTDPRLIDTGRSMQLSRIRIIGRIVLPSALPSIMTGVRVAATIALAVVIGVEIVGGTGNGLGTYIENATSTGATDQAYVGAFIAAIVGLAITGLFTLAERRTLRWTPDRR